MNLLVKLLVIAALCVTATACSNNNTPPPTTSAPVASSVAPPPASAIPMQAPATGDAAAASQSPALLTHAPSLQVILQRPSFAKAFAGMDGASTLPAWVKTADQSQPSARVEVDGQAMWLSHVCEVSGCAGAQLFLLTDPAAQKIQGLLVMADGTPGATVRQLTWLGQPDAVTQAFLKSQSSHG